MTEIAHATIVLERTYKAAPARVFAAWESVEAREQWAAPADGVRVKYVEASFREGGVDVTHCIEADEKTFETRGCYMQIVPGQRIVFTEQIYQAGAQLSAALVSVELAAAGAGTRQVVTLQIASFVGEDMTQGYDSGWTVALDNLAKVLDQ